jgi:hypothetical protein
MALHEEREDRLREVEGAMARRIPTRQLEAMFAKRWNISVRQVRRYVATVRDRWREEAQELESDRPKQRDAMRASLNVVFSKAMTKTAVVKDAAGNPLIDPATGRPLTMEAPDLRGAVQAAKVLVALDALDAPQRVELGGTVDHTVSGEGIEDLKNFLLGVKTRAQAAKGAAT